MALRWVQVEKAFVEGADLSDIASATGLSEDEALGKCVRLWAWSLTHAAPEGIFTSKDPVRAVEHAARWSGKRGAFVAALGEVLECHPGHVRFKGWPDRYLPLLKRQERDRVRKSTGSSGGVPCGIPGGVPPDLPGGVPGGIPQESLSSLISRSVSSVSSLERPAEALVVSDLEKRISDTFERIRGRPYRWGRGDHEALRQLHQEGQSHDEILLRLANGIPRTSFPRINCVADLVKPGFWNACAEAEKPPPGRKSLSREATDAEIREQTSKLPVDENGDYVL